MAKLDDKTAQESHRQPRLQPMRMMWRWQVAQVSKPSTKFNEKNIWSIYIFEQVLATQASTSPIGNSPVKDSWDQRIWAVANQSC